MKIETFNKIVVIQLPEDLSYICQFILDGRNITSRVNVGYRRRITFALRSAKKSIGPKKQF